MNGGGALESILSNDQVGLVKQSSLCRALFDGFGLYVLYIMFDVFDDCFTLLLRKHECACKGTDGFAL